MLGRLGIPSTPMSSTFSRRVTLSTLKWGWRGHGTLYLGTRDRRRIHAHARSRDRRYSAATRSRAGARRWLGASREVGDIGDLRSPRTRRLDSWCRTRLATMTTLALSIGRNPTQQACGNMNVVQLSNSLLPPPRRHILRINRGTGRVRTTQHPDGQNDRRRRQELLDARVRHGCVQGSRAICDTRILRGARA